MKPKKLERDSKGKYNVEWEGETLALNSVTTITSCAMKYSLLAFYGKHGTEEAKQIASDAADIGNDTHAYAEGYFRGLKKLITTGDAYAVRNCISNFKTFIKYYKATPALIDGEMALEVPLYSITHRYAGTCDGLFWVTDPATKESFLVLLDWKTSKGLWDDYTLQIEGYYEALKEMVERGIIKLEAPVTELWVVRFDKEGSINVTAKKDVLRLQPGNASRFKAFLGLSSYLYWTQLPKKEK